MESIISSLVLICSSLAFGQSPIIPTPTSYNLLHGEVHFQDEFKADSTTFELNNWSFFKEELKTISGLELVHSTNKNALKSEHFIADMPGAHGAAYALFISEDKFSINCQSQAAQYYALNSILQLFENNGSNQFIKSCRIEDSPKYSWRGLHLDVSRHFFTVAEVKRYIDLMSLYKFNVFHWHLTDDQGWRIEIKKYPRLTEIGGYRDSTVIGHYSDSPRTYIVEKYGGFYTQEDIKKIVEYASSKYITVVPEIEMPGHSRAALAAYPELSCTGNENAVPGLWGVFDDIYCSKEESIQFMKDVLLEVLELFPSEYIHIGGDEAPKTRWKQCKDCQNVISENGLKDEHELQSYFIQQIDAFLTSKGRKLIGWDEILEGGLSKNAAVMSWRGTEGGKEAAMQKHEVVMSPTSHCYFDYYQSANPSEPLAIGGYLPLNIVYDFNPIPDDFPEDMKQYIIGGQANLWTEYIPTMKQLEYMTYPRALAMSQTLWSNNKPTYDEFLRTYLDYHEHYLTAHGVNQSEAVHHPKFEVTRTMSGINVYVRSEVESDAFTVSTKHIGGHTMSGGQVMGTKDYLKFEREKSGATKTIRLGVLNDDGTIALKQDFLLHSIIGKNIEIKPAPHPKFNHNGDLTLVDGILGRKPWIGSEWLGFTEEIIVITLFDLGSSAIDSLHIGFLEDNGSWIYLPTEIEVQLSNDLKWKKCKNKYTADIEMESFKMPIGRQGNNMRITIKAMKIIPEGQDGSGHVPWTFIDEIRISEKP